MKNGNAFAVAAALLLGVATGAAVAQSRARLTVLQNTVPTDARKIGGKIYVPIADVAKAMGWKLTVAGNNILLQPPATPVKPGGNTSLPSSSLSGVVGETIRAETFRFLATTVSQTEKYDRRYSSGIGVGEAVVAETGTKLVVVDCVLTNASADREEYCFSRDRYAENTLLLDQSGESLPPYAIDVATDELNPPGAFALAGANIRFALVFRVPLAWQPKALVYSVVCYRARGMKKGTDVRVNL